MVEIDPNVTVTVPGDDGYEYRRKGLELTTREFAYYPIHLIAQTDMDEFQVRQGNIGNVEVKSLFGSSYSIEFGVHERWLDGTFEFKPHGEMPQAGQTVQGTGLHEMDGLPAEVGKLMVEGIGVLPWEFSELNAASIGHTNLTDYEFKWESQIDAGEARNAMIPGGLKQTFDELKE